MEDILSIPFNANLALFFVAISVKSNGLLKLKGLKELIRLTDSTGEIDCACLIMVGIPLLTLDKNINNNTIKNISLFFLVFIINLPWYYWSYDIIPQ